MLLVDAIRSHVFAAERIHADDTKVPVLAKRKTRIGRVWTYGRDDRPGAGARSADRRVLLCAYTGARLNEITSLHPADIRTMSGSAANDFQKAHGLEADGEQRGAMDSHAPQWKR